MKPKLQAFLFLSVVISCAGFFCLHFALFPNISDGAKIAVRYNQTSITAPPETDANVFTDAVAMAKAASFAKVLAIFGVFQNLMVFVVCVVLFITSKPKAKPVTAN